MATQLSDDAIYTMRHSRELELGFTAGKGSLLEHQAWTTGQKLFAEAAREGRRLAIVFSAAEADSGLIFWGVVDRIHVARHDDGTAETRCDYSGLTRIEPARPLSALTLKSKRRPLSDNYIRPYALCVRPSFIQG